jgi:hypothetical protein
VTKEIGGPVYDVRISMAPLCFKEPVSSAKTKSNPGIFSCAQRPVCLTDFKFALDCDMRDMRQWRVAHIT